MPAADSQAGPSSNRPGRTTSPSANGHSKRRRTDEDDAGRHQNGARRSTMNNSAEGNDSTGMSQSLNDKGAMHVRSTYRDMIKQAQEARLNIADFTTKDLIELINDSSKLFKEVQGPQVGVLDGAFLKLVTAIGASKSQALKIESGFEVGEFMERAMRAIGGRLLDDEDDDEDEDANTWDWSVLGRRAAALSQRAVTVDHLLGPLQSNAKNRTVTESVRVDRSGARKQPTQLEADAISTNAAETSVIVHGISMKLDEVGGAEGINLFRFVVNPHSFSNTVENMFYVSFLIKEGTASIDEDDNGEPILLSTRAPTDEDYEQGVARRQIIMELDMDVWKNLIAEYGIRDTVIPTRFADKSAQQETWRSDRVQAAAER